MEYEANLTEADRQLLYEQRHSEQFRVFSKAIKYLESVAHARLTVAQQAELPVLQGKLQGLLAARNILSLGKLPEH